MAGVLPNVLLVDDSPQDLEIMSLYLREMAVVHTAANGPEALEYVKRNKIDVILLDIEMPFMDGFEAVERCKAQGAKKTVLQECYTYNPVACLAKPVSKEVLEQNIEQALNR